MDKKRVHLPDCGVLRHFLRGVEEVGLDIDPVGGGGGGNGGRMLGCRVAKLVWDCGGVPTSLTYLHHICMSSTLGLIN